MASREGSRKHPVLSGLLAILVPGLGHLYIRLWGRAILWFGLYFLATQLFLPTAAMPEELSLGAIVDASAGLPFQGVVLVVAITALNAVDAYLLTHRLNRSRTGRTADGTPTCPHCRRELDADLEFCHWCTAELDADGDPTG